MAPTLPGVISVHEVPVLLSEHHSSLSDGRGEDERRQGRSALAPGKDDIECAQAGAGATSSTRLPEVSTSSTPAGRLSEMPSAGQRGTMTSYEYTFRLMTVRRLDREILGTFAKQRGRCRNLILVLGFMALEVGLASITLREGISLKIDLGDNPTLLLANLLGLLLLSVLLYAAINAVTVVRWCLFWCARRRATARRERGGGVRGDGAIPSPGPSCTAHHTPRHHCTTRPTPRHPSLRDTTHTAPSLRDCAAPHDMG
jgi:hypothetical protein